MHEYGRSAEMVSGLSDLEILLWVVALFIGLVGIAVGLLSILVAWKVFRISGNIAGTIKADSDEADQLADQDASKVDSRIAKKFTELLEALGIDGEGDGDPPPPKESKSDVQSASTDAEK